MIGLPEDQKLAELKRRFQVIVGEQPHAGKWSAEFTQTALPEIHECITAAGITPDRIIEEDCKVGSDSGRSPGRRIILSERDCQATCEQIDVKIARIKSERQEAFRQRSQERMVR